MGKSPWRREELLHLLSLCGTLAGLCITSVTLLHTLFHGDTIVDDMLSVCALGFLLCTYFIFISLRVQNENLQNSLSKIIDVLFTFALSAMVMAGFMMVYTLW